MGRNNHNQTAAVREATYNFLVVSVESQTVFMTLVLSPFGVLKFGPVCRRQGDWMSLIVPIHDSWLGFYQLWSQSWIHWLIMKQNAVVVVLSKLSGVYWSPVHIQIFVMQNGIITNKSDRQTKSIRFRRDTTEMRKLLTKVLLTWKLAGLLPPVSKSKSKSESSASSSSSISSTSSSSTSGTKSSSSAASLS